MIVIRDLHKIYGRGLNATHALKGINLEIREGEFVAIMGRSGSGKSTLLHILGLLDYPSSGEIYIEGIDVSRMSREQRGDFRLRRLGYVFQEYSLLGELSVLENVYLPSLAANPYQDYRRRASELLEMVGLGERLTHYPSEVSGGEQQRIAIARALVNSPGILFADEPTASLDVKSAMVVLDLFRRLNTEKGQTVVMVTHEPGDERYVDRVIRLSDGRIDGDEE